MQIKTLTVQGFRSLRDFTLHQPGHFIVLHSPAAQAGTDVLAALEFMGVAHAGQAASFEEGANVFSQPAPAGDSPSLTFEIASDQIGIALRITQIGDFWMAQSGLAPAYLGQDELLTLLYDITDLPAINGGKDHWPFSGLLQVRRVALRQDTALSTEAKALLQRHWPDASHWTGPESTESRIQSTLANALSEAEGPHFICMDLGAADLHSEFAKGLVEFLRSVCSPQGHHVWLSSGSSALAEAALPHELVVLEQAGDSTQVRVQGSQRQG